MKKFWTSKKFWLIFLALVIIGLFVYFIFFVKSPDHIDEDELPEEVKKDRIPPSTAIVSPENKSWWNKDFQVTINDSDIGSGLIDFIARKKGCQYLIVDLGTDQAKGGFRKCDPVDITIPVGLEKTCSSSYSKDNVSLGKCKVSTRAFDQAGNDSGWKSKVFNIDLIKPEVQKIVVNQNLELNQEHVFNTTVSDNSKITGCWFYINGKPLDAPVTISPIPCENENQCNISLNHSFDKEEDFFVRFVCSDIAGNIGSGELVEIKVATNHPPQISSCRVNPTQGTSQTGFQFNVTASDSEEDQIFYLWDFGDNKTSVEQNPVHFYEKTGIFEPSVSASDNQTRGNDCSTAWVTIVED